MGIFFFVVIFMMFLGMSVFVFILRFSSSRVYVATFVSYFFNFLIVCFVFFFVVIFIVVFVINIVMIIFGFRNVFELFLLFYSASVNDTNVASNSIFIIVLLNCLIINDVNDVFCCVGSVFVLYVFFCCCMFV